MVVDISGKKVTILGAGRSGLGAAQLLAEQKAQVFISDYDLSKRTPDLIKLSEQYNISFEVGQHSDKIFNADFVVLSPGISQTVPVVQKIVQKKMPLFSELEVAYWFADGPVVGVTGSNGKTTTAQLLGEILQYSDWKTFVGGNIGIPFSLIVYKSRQYSTRKLFIVEISSFQLEKIVTFRPYVAVLLNITPDHLNRYKSFQHYVDTKAKIFQNQNPEDSIVYNADDDVVKSIIPDHVHQFPFGFNRDQSHMVFLESETLYINEEEKPVPLIKREEIQLLGEHNLLNIMASVNVGLIFGVDVEMIAQVLKTFTGIEHRLEFVRETKGIKFYNDSKATNVDSVKYALRSFDSPIHLIMGGRDKDGDFPVLREYMRHVKKIYVIGEATNKIFKALNEVVPILICSSLNEAVQKAFKGAEKGDIVLLSPGCASFDMFYDFEDRGNQFKETVWKIAP
jgi:UDP-N-acetylmuramoylalanine--D-glutamate ligase